MNKHLVIDMFCGAGGESNGIIRAASKLGMNIELHAINHWERAIETHKANHPDAQHYREDIFQLDPLQVAAGRTVELLWASPECTHFSCARGGKPCDNQSRSSARQILQWCKKLDIQRLIVENVKEFITWGPLYKRGKKKNRPIPSQKGVYFRCWLKELEALGYTVDHKILNCADYGDATTRRRLFVQAVKGGKKIIWPSPTHKEGESWRAAKEIIDWTLPSESIFSRKRPLAENTLKRIEAGIRKYWGAYAEPFLLVMKGKSQPVDLNVPLPTITTKQHLALVEPFVMNIGQTNGGDRTKSINEPLSTVVSKQEHCLIQPFITAYHAGDPNRNHKVDDPLPTVDCANRFGLVEPFICQSEHGERVSGVNSPMKTITGSSRGFSLVQPFIVQYYGNGLARDINQPLDTVTCKDRFALIDGCPVKLDIRFRMLQPHELAAAMSFPRSYKFMGTKGEVTKQIGNAVPGKVSENLVKASLGVKV